MPEITIVMPALNVRNYIRPCLESVLNQSFRDIEVLAVDAGSTDGTQEILEEYAGKDRRLHVIHSDKKSYGYQVNLGIESAAGGYIGIVETDDMIAKDMYQVLYQTVSSDHLEYAKCGFLSFVESDNGLRWYQKGGRCIAGSDLIGKIISPRSMPELAIQDYYLWAGLYRKDFLKNIRLSETPGAAFQDIGFIYQVLSTADRAAYLDNELYFYRQTGNNSSFQKKGFQYLIQEYALLARVLPSRPDEWVHAFYARMFRQTVGRFERMAVGGTDWKETEDDVMVLLGQLRQAENERRFRPEKMSDDNRAIYDRLKENAYGMFSDECVLLEPMIHKLRALFDQIGNRRVVIFGCGEYGKYTHVLLDTYKPGKVCAYCDNNKSLQGTKVQGVEVTAPETAVGTYPDAEYVTANRNGWPDIGRQLMELGIRDEQLCRYQPDFDIRLFTLQGIY